MFSSVDASCPANSELKKRCSKDDTRFPKLQSAINSLQITANHVNEGVRAREERMKLMDLEKEFRGGAITHVYATACARKACV